MGYQGNKVAFRLVFLSRMLRALFLVTLIFTNPSIANDGMELVRQLNLGNFSDEAKTNGFSALQESIDQGDPQAKLVLGIIKLLGIGVASNESEGVALISSVASSNTNNASAQAIAERLLKIKDELIKWRQGNARLSCGTGCAFSRGLNSENMRQLFKLEEWFDLAVITLEVGYQDDLSYFYLGRTAEGIGDYSNAITYYRLALDPNTRGHQCSSSVCNGVNVASEAKDRIYIVRGLLDKQQTEHDTERRKKEAAAAAKLEEARQLTLKEERTIEFNTTLQNADSGTCTVQHQLAKMYFAGDGTAADEKSGLNWLSKSAQKGCSDAQYELSKRYRAGNGLAKNAQKADDLLLKSSRQGYPEAQEKMREIQAIKQERASQIAAAESEKLEKLRAAEQKLIQEKQEIESKRKLENINKLKSL